jgi:hypothetical protein
MPEPEKSGMKRICKVLASLGVAAIFTTGVTAAAAMPGPGAAYPRGSYAALDKLPDWGGVWVFSFAPPPAGTPARQTPALKGKYLADFQAWQKEVQARQGLVAKSTSNCMPPGMPIVMQMPQYPMEFLNTPGRTTTLHEAWMQWRTIFTDGRTHPDDWEGGIFGHSIGHWEGNVLVVNTIGIKTITDMGMGMHHSDKMQVSERIHLLAGKPDTLVDEMTITDPEALEKPFTQWFFYDRHRDWNLLEFICAENDRNPVSESGETQFLSK